MRSLVGLLLLALAGVICALPAEAKVWRVRIGGGDAPSIQAAIDSAFSGDSVLVGSGTFLESISFQGKNIVVRSELGYGATTLDGSLFSAPVVSFKSGETREAVLEGFTITGGLGSAELGGPPKGGGILCIGSSPSILNNRIHTNTLSTPHSAGAGMAVVERDPSEPLSTPLIQGNIFENNSCAGNGGALAIQQTCAVVRNNIFRNNSCAEDGGAIWNYVYLLSPVIDHNWVSDNHADDHGGGIYIGSNSEAIAIELTSNILIRNSATGISPYDTTSGGGVWLGNISGTVANNTVVDNTGNDESGCLGGVGIALYRVSPQLEVTANIITFKQGCGLVCLGDNPFFGSNLIWNDGSPQVGGCDAMLAAAIVADPLFCDPGTDDYSLAANSPAHVGGTTMGAIEAPGCGPSRVQPATWGRIKSMFTQRK